jgi:hypothetical protein
VCIRVIRGREGLWLHEDRPESTEPEGGANDEERGHIAAPIERHRRAPRHGSPVSLGAVSFHSNAPMRTLSRLRVGCDYIAGGLACGLGGVLLLGLPAVVVSIL